MIQLIYAPKGSGKTKRLLDLANEELKTTKGDVVFIDNDKRYMYELKHQIRFVDVKDYEIDNMDSLYGLICGMVAQNYDIEAIYIDAFLKIIRTGVNELEGYMKKLKKLAKNHDFKAVIIISADPEKAPEYLKKHII